MLSSAWRNARKKPGLSTASWAQSTTGSAAIRPKPRHARSLPMTSQSAENTRGLREMATTTPDSATLVSRGHDDFDIWL